MGSVISFYGDPFRLSCSHNRLPPENWHDNGKSPFSTGNIYIFKWFVFQCHVSFPGCRFAKSFMFDLGFWKAIPLIRFEVEHCWSSRRQKTRCTSFHREFLFVRYVPFNTFLTNFDSWRAETQEELWTVPGTKKDTLLMFSLYNCPAWVFTTHS